MAEDIQPGWQALRPLYPDRPDLAQDRRDAMPIPELHKQIDEALERQPRLLLDRWPDIVGFGIGVRERAGHMVADDLVLTCFVEQKRAPSALEPSRRIDGSVEIAGAQLATDVVEIGSELQRAQTAATVNPAALAQNDPGLDVPLIGGMEIGRLTAQEHGTMAAVFRDWGGGGRIWVTNTHVADAGGGPMIQPHSRLLRHNELGRPDLTIPYIVPALGPLPIQHLDAARGRLRLRAVDPPGAPTHTAPRVPRGELLDGGTMRGWIDAYPGQQVRKSGSFSTVTRGYTLVGSGLFSMTFLSALLPVPIPGLAMGSMIAGLTIHRLYSHHGDSGSAIVDDQDRFTALLWGGAYHSATGGSRITFGDIASNVMLWLGVRP